MKEFNTNIRVSHFYSCIHQYMENIDVRTIFDSSILNNYHFGGLELNNLYIVLNKILDSDE